MLGVNWGGGLGLECFLSSLNLLLSLTPKLRFLLCEV